MTGGRVKFGTRARAELLVCVCRAAVPELSLAAAVAFFPETLHVIVFAVVDFDCPFNPGS